ncbi:MAG: hypothetical protein IJ218_03185 [Alphaproteobacteria bacterium]|nr:hypothetical protein [Alphaproteobacteria bacterium]
MKKILFFIATIFLFAQTANAASNQLTYEEEMYLLGTMSGKGLACKSQKYHQFELLARALIVSKAPNAEIQQRGMREYTSGKVDAFTESELDNFADCAQILKAFNNQKIFQSVLYANGKIKMYDGTIITPRQPYDASKLYVKDREAFRKADAAYKNSLAQAQKNAQNMKKVPLTDARYESYAQQFSQ